jgi:CheY-like chemotaxis protein
VRERAANVLVVDDDEDVVELLRFLLESNGYRATVAMNGREALEAVVSGLPDLILLDLKMPIMDGPTFALELRRRHSSAPPIVVVTAADDARKRATEISAAGWIAKPFEPAELLSVVARHLPPMVRVPVGV